MTRYARILDGRVAEIIKLDVFAPSAVFHPDVAATIVAVDETVGEGWGYVDEQFIPSLPPPPPTEAGLVAYAAELRGRREVGGIVVAGVPVATDDRSKMMIVCARVAAMADPEWTTVWRGADGNTYPINAQAMIAISDAVQAHVNDSFATFAAVKAHIESGEISSHEEVASAF